MLNDVHAPPLEPRSAVPGSAIPRSARLKPVRRSVRERLQATPPAGDRAHSLERQADHHGGTNLLFSDPEDRGDSFNTTMSAAIVGGVLVTLAIVAWLLWK